jgi:hypothetical protein
MLSEEFRELFLADLREKAKARPKVAVGKKRPRQIITPSSLKEKVPWWKVAPVLVHVCIVTGKVLVNRWPLE